MSEVRIMSASLEEHEETGHIIVRGVLDQETLKFINMAWYQREAGFSSTHINEIIAAYFSGCKVADITLGMRGQRCTSSKDGTYKMNDKCYCIDGGQRLYAAALAVKARPDVKICLGAKCFVGTTEEFENELFCQLGTTQVRISPSVLLRNRKKKSEAAKILVEMNKNPDFALKDRIAWDQTKTRHELLAGYTFARIIGALHCHKGGALKSSKVFDLLAGFDNLLAKIGQENLERNIIRFFDAIDKCWTVRQLSGGRESRPHLKPLFLITLGRLFSGYPEFWDGKQRDEFYITDRHLRRLKNFKLSAYVAASNKLPQEALFELLRQQLGLDPFAAADKDERAA